MMALTYGITLREPLLATALDGDPNSAVSHHYIPGSMIRGLVAAQLARQNPDLATAERTLLFSGQVRYLNAYPGHLHGWRSLPVPRSWRRDKERADNPRIEDHALIQESEFQATRDINGFVFVEDDEAQLAPTNRHIMVHTRRDRFAGRPRPGAAGGAVYQYDALAPGLHFRGAILVADNTQAQTMRDLLPVGEYRLGGARTAGYGLVWLDDVQLVDSWLEYGESPTSVSAGQCFRVTLLSDTILRDGWGATHTDLAAALGLPVRCQVAFKQITAVGGFNRKWGTPLPQEQALQAGSVFVLCADAEISAQQLQTLIQNGIGERRAEGFGRIALNWPQEGELNQVSRDAERNEILPVQLTASERLMAQRMATRRRRHTLEHQLAAAIRTVTQPEPTRRPPTSQLARVRIIVRSALKERDTSRLLDLFADDGDKNPRALKANARQKFARCRLAGASSQRLNEWIRELCHRPEESLSRIFRNLQSQTLGNEAPDDWFTEEYALRLIDGVLEELMRQNRKGGN
jgi:CRISPR-associated protein Csx10